MKDGNCTVCVGKCGHADHANMAFYFEITMIKTKEKAENVYNAYIDAKNQKSKSQQILDGLSRDVKYNELECISY
jgi:hypothetical protein